MEPTQHVISRKVLPCRCCGVAVEIPRKYARAKSAVCLDCTNKGRNVPSSQ